MALDIKLAKDHPDIAVVNLKGRLDVYYSSEIENELVQLIQTGTKKLILSLNDIEYLSSSGLRVFIAVSRKLKEGNGQLKLIKLNETAKKIFKIVELIDMFDIYETEEDAIRSFS
jgi:anti-anti-sigma factor